MRRRRGWLRPTLLGLCGVVGVVVIGAAILVATFNADSYKPRIAEAVKQATGRDLTINGRIGLGFSLHPTVEVRDAALSNPPGFSRPEMARIGELDVRLDLLPLLHGQIAIERLVLSKPDILLETGAKGVPNWRFEPQPPAVAVQATPGAPAKAAKPLAVTLNEIRIEDGVVAYRDDRTGHVATVSVQTLSAEGSGPDGPLQIAGKGAINGVAIGLEGKTGSAAALQNPAGGKPWPVDIVLTAAGARLAVQGTVARPMAGEGYDLAVKATVPDLGALRPIVPHAKLPPLKDIALAAHVADQGGKLPAVSALTLTSGGGDMSSVLPGMALQRLNVSMPALDRPVKAELAATYAGAPVTAVANIGAPAKLITGQPAGPFPIDITAKAAEANVSVKGGVADPAHLSGLDVALHADAADLSALSPLVGTALPKLTGFRFDGQVREAQGGLAKGVSFSGLTLKSAQADAAGDLAVGFGSVPALRGKLTSERVDADALRAAMPKPAAPAGAAPAAVAPAPAHPEPARGPGPVIPDTKLPWAELRRADADVTLAVNTLVTGGETWRAVSGHLVLQEGKLRVSPLKATMPAGAVDMSVEADATQTAPPVAVRLQAPSIAVQALLSLLGQSAYARGNAAISADLRGAGASPHAIAASLDGTFSLTMGGGEIDSRLLEKTLGPVIARTNPTALLGQGGTSQIRCLAVRAVAQKGTATLNPLVLSSSQITVEGSGTLNLGAETMDLHLRPQGRIGGTGFEVPVTMTGSFRDPHVALNATGAAHGIEAIIGAFSKDPKQPGVAAPSCGAALSEARGEQSPAAPSAAAPAAPKVPDAGALLRQLFHR